MNSKRGLPLWLADVFADAVIGALAGGITFYVTRDWVAASMVAALVAMLCLAYQASLPSEDVGVLSAWATVGWICGLLSARMIGSWAVGLAIAAFIWLLAFIVERWPPYRWKRRN